ncbi:MAG: hypothetical protein WC076_08380 [Terrimicrobiaceae bacterium]|nr:hypothetical protein [Terrimicrobiaceae bacterium]
MTEITRGKCVPHWIDACSTSARAIFQIALWINKSPQLDGFSLEKTKKLTGCSQGSTIISKKRQLSANKNRYFVVFDVISMFLGNESEWPTNPVFMRFPSVKRECSLQDSNL